MTQASTTAGSWLAAVGRGGLTVLVYVYQGLSAVTPASCRYEPSCSHYALAALRDHGALRGGWLALRRVAGMIEGNPYMDGDTLAQWEGDPRHAPPGGFLAMPPQLTDGRVTYMDGTEASVDQMAYDVAQFLAWAGEPKQANRKSLGLSVILYLVIFAILLWFSYKQIWRKVDH